MKHNSLISRKTRWFPCYTCNPCVVFFNSCSYFIVPLFVFLCPPSSLFVLSCSKLTQTGLSTKAPFLLTNPAVSQLLFPLIHTGCKHMNISRVYWAVEICVQAFWVQLPAVDACFTWVFSTDKPQLKMEFLFCLWIKPLAGGSMSCGPIRVAAFPQIENVPSPVGFEVVLKLANFQY